MVKFRKWLLAVMMVLSVISPLTLSAQETAVTTDEMAINIIDSFKDIKSAKSTFSGQADFEDSEEAGVVNFDGNLEFVISPAFEFAFDFLLALESPEENETMDVKAYLVGDTIHYFYDDSAEEGDGNWEELNAAETLGMDPSQFNAVYQMLISAFEGYYRGIYLTSRVHTLVSEKTIIEENADGYTVTINSFETEEEWLDFFEAVEELQASLNTDGDDIEVEIDTPLDDLDELQNQALIMSENLTYSLVFEVGQDFRLHSLTMVAQATAPEEEAAEAELSKFDFQFNLEFTEFDFTDGITLPAELE